jgi:hypothetical protein
VICRRVRLLALILLCGAWPAASELLSAPPFHITHGTEDTDLAAYTAEVLREAVAEFAPVLPLKDAPVQVVIAENYSAFRAYAPRLAQHNVAGLAKAEEGLIVVKPPRLLEPGSDYRGTLRHELVHILLARNTDTGRLPRWLNEGLCMSLANEYRWESMLQIARMFGGGRMLELRNLDLAFTAPGDEMEFGDAYAQALSMTRYLRDRLGEQVFWQVIYALREMPFHQALEKVGGLRVEDFDAGYRRSLWWIALVGSVATGSIFGPAALLVIVAWWRKRRQNRRTLDQWAFEEAMGADEKPFDWDDLVEDPDAWKRGTEHDSDPDR